MRAAPMRILLAVCLHLSLLAFAFPGTARAARDGIPLRPSIFPSSVTASLRVRTSIVGLHRLSYDDLTRGGVPPGAPTASFAMSYLGSPVALEARDADGTLSPDDLFIFHAEAYAGRYMKDNVYFFSYGGPPGDRMAERPSAAEAGQPERDWAYATLRIESDEQYFSNYPLPSTADHFFDAPTLQANASVPSTSISYDLGLQNARASGNIRFRGLFYGGVAQEANPDQSVKVMLNAHELGTFAWDGRADHLAVATAPATYLDGAPNRLVVEASQTQLPAGTDYYAYVDWLELDYPAALVADADRLSAQDLDLADESSVEVIASGFSTGAVTVYDVRNPRAPVIITGPETKAGDGGYAVRFRDEWAASGPPPAYILTATAALRAPLAVEVADAPAWNTLENSFDYIAIVHRSLWDAVQPLLDHRAAQGLRVAKVDPQHIYDLYRGGRLDPEAIRTFLTYAYYHWNGTGTRPRYVLLAGDGHYDFKNALGTPLKNLVPPYLLDIDPWIGETAADNRYVAVEGPGDFTPEMAIGRIPAQTPQELTYAVDKILQYEDSTRAADGPWQNTVTFMADAPDIDAGDFQALSEDTRRNWLPPSYDSRHIYWQTDYVTTASMQTAIKDSFTDSILVQWFGHASRFRWGNTTGIFNVFSVSELPQTAQWPVSIDYSCWTGYFINLAQAVSNGQSDYHALAEKLLLAEGKGSVAAIAPSGQHVGHALQVLNRGFVKAIFQDEIQPIGDAFNAAKDYYAANATGWPDVIDTTILFGDPALKLRIAPRARPPTLAICRSVSPGAIDLAWAHLEANDTYEVWRDESPYFEPGLAGRQVGAVDGAGYATAATIVFSDDGAAPPPITVLGDPETNYFWVTRGVNTTGTSANSNRTGEFDFALEPGDAGDP